MLLRFDLPGPDGGKRSVHRMKRERVCRESRSNQIEEGGGVVWELYDRDCCIVDA